MTTMKVFTSIIMFLFVTIVVTTTTTTTTVTGQRYGPCNFCIDTNVVTKPKAMVESDLLSLLGLSGKIKCQDLHTYLNTPYTITRTCSLFQRAKTIQTNCGCGESIPSPTAPSSPKISPVTTGSGGMGSMTMMKRKI